MKHNGQSLSERDQDSYLKVFRRLPLALREGKGAIVWDTNGQKYIDMLAGIAVNNVGHAHPTLVNAVAEQASKLIHISNFYVSEPQVKLAEKLNALSGLDRTFFSNSGTESVEGAIKLARKYGHAQGRGGTIISMDGSFHGRTLAAIATGKPAMQAGFEPIPSGFKKAVFNNLESVIEAATDDVAGILVEPIQGEGGINVATPCFLQGLRQLCNERNIALIFDEIQCGIGRTGKMFCHEHYGIKPDIMTLAKGLGGGVPVGAILCNDKIGDAIEYGDHGTTFGGNPLACAAGLATLNIIENEKLLEKAEINGKWFRDAIWAMKAQFPFIKEVRGKGLMIGVELAFEAKPLVLELMEKHHILANATAGNVIRFVPPLIISRDLLNEVVEKLAAVFAEQKETANA